MQPKNPPERLITDHSLIERMNHVEAYSNYWEAKRRAIQFNKHRYHDAEKFMQEIADLSFVVFWNRCEAIVDVLTVGKV